jgi:hypothetical protein
MFLFSGKTRYLLTRFATGIQYQSTVKARVFQPMKIPLLPPVFLFSGKIGYHMTHFATVVPIQGLNESEDTSFKATYSQSIPKGVNINMAPDPDERQTRNC